MILLPFLFMFPVFVILNTVEDKEALMKEECISLRNDFPSHDFKVICAEYTPKETLDK
jgi:hypothetical protein